MIPHSELLGCEQLTTACRKSQAHVLWPPSTAMPLLTCSWPPAVTSHSTPQAPRLRADLCAFVHVLLPSLGSATCPHWVFSSHSHMGSSKGRLLPLQPPSLPLCRPCPLCHSQKVAPTPSVYIPVLTVGLLKVSTCGLPLCSPRARQSARYRMALSTYFQLVWKVIPVLQKGLE